MSSFDYSRYLAAKRSVDERAINVHVWDCLVKQLSSADGHAPLTVLELGAGVGSMALRFLESTHLPNAHYTLVDLLEPNLAAARQLLLTKARHLDFYVSEADGVLYLANDYRNWVFEFHQADVYDFLQQHPRQSELLIGHALLDLLDLPTALPRFSAAVADNGFFYFPINYDGLTSFEPVTDAAFEAEVLAAYHHTMDTRLTNGLHSGDSQTGRHLIPALQALGAEVLAAGSSDWLVFAQDARYPAEEAYFLECILNTFESALRDFPGFDSSRFVQWLATRRAQLASGELIYLAHQIDVFARLRR
jgi:SAM-dependent methyltransferase